MLVAHNTEMNAGYLLSVVALWIYHVQVDDNITPK